MSGRRSGSRIERGKKEESGSGVKWVKRKERKKMINDKCKENGRKKKNN